MKSWIFLVLGAFILAGLFLTFRPPPPPPLPASPVTTAPSAADAPPARAVQLIDVIARGGHRVSGPDTVQLHLGDAVQLRVTADQADTLHLHGYDLALELSPNEPASLMFRASQSGRFEYELHHAHTVLGVLEVSP